MKTPPLVSIVTATWNAERSIARAMASVRAQTYSNVEHIIVDGGSTDGTMSTVHSLADGRVRFVSEADRGIYDAWNKGVRMAEGEWIAFLGADDVLLPDAVSQYMRRADEQPDAEYISGRVLWRGTGGQRRVIGRAWSWPRFGRYMSVAHVGSMHRRSLFTRYGAFDDGLRMVGDYEFLLRARGGLKAAFLPRITAEMEGGGATDSTAAIDEAAQVKVRTGGRPRALVAVERGYAKLIFHLRRSGVFGTSGAQRRKP